MTRKHFIAIAKILRENNASISMQLAFVAYLKTENAFFDEQRFIDAIRKED